MKLLLIILLITLSTNVFSGLGPGMIPLKYGGSMPASDLIIDGKAVLPTEIHKQYMASGKTLDISKINPSESDIWKDKGFTRDEGLQFDENSNVKFITTLGQTRLSSIRFSVKQMQNGVGQEFTLWASKTAHNMLLRAELLKKLGYKVPPLKHIKKITIKFPRRSSIKVFINKISVGGKDPNRWVVNINETNNELTLRDLIVGSAYNHIYNLAVGSVRQDIIKGRRVLNSLIIPYTLAYIPESINLMSWHGGRIIGDSVKMEYPYDQEFTTPYNDALWMIRRLLKLTREDFITIAKAGVLPEPVEKLLVEKMIARRNQLTVLFNISAELIPYNSKISDQEALKNGKIIKKNWKGYVNGEDDDTDKTGYASRFLYTQPESPFSNEELFAFFKSKGLSNVITNLMTKVNEYLPKVDLTSNIMEKQYELAMENFKSFLQTGKVKKTSFGMWAVPMGGANLIASREIITGSYQGTDNIVQLADIIGIHTHAGAFIGTKGIKAPWALSGTTEASYTRTYAHLIPIKSMKKALKYPFKNAIIPYLKLKHANLIGDILDTQLEGNSDKFHDEVRKLLGVFTEDLQVGESIIVTDTIGGTLSINGRYTFPELLAIQASFNSSQVVIARTHIYRKSENSIHVYKDIGDKRKISLTFELKEFIPIITLSRDKATGHAKTKFYEVNINPSLTANPDLFENLRALRSLFLWGKTKPLKRLNAPYVLRRKFKQTNSHGSFLFWRWDNLVSNVYTTVKHPKGFKKHYFRRVRRSRDGKNFQQFGLDVLNGVINEWVEYDDLSVSSGGGSDPGDTIFGSSKKKDYLFEGEIENYDGKKCGFINKPFLSMREMWKGWTISKEKAENILGKIRAEYGEGVFPPEALNETEKILLYNITFNVMIYKKGFTHLLDTQERTFIKLFEKYATKEYPDNGMEYSWKDKVRQSAYKTMDLISKYQKSFEQCDINKYSKYAVNLIKHVRELIPSSDFINLVGGEKNIYAMGVIKGFREGDENGDTPFFSNSIGEFGDSKILGPLLSMQHKLNMTESEFYAYWIINRP